MKSIIPCISFICMSLLSYSLQAKEVQNLSFEYNEFRSIRMTGMGVGGWWGVHYERSWLSYHNFKFNTRLGFSTYSLRDFENVLNPDIQIPMSLGIAYGDRHQVGFKTGVTAHRVVVIKKEVKTSKWEWSPFLSLHYRFSFHPNWFGQVAVNYIMVPSQKSYLWPGISIGRNL